MANILLPTKGGQTSNGDKLTLDEFLRSATIWVGVSGFEELHESHKSVKGAYDVDIHDISRFLVRRVPELFLDCSNCGIGGAWRYGCYGSCGAGIGYNSIDKRRLVLDRSNSRL